MTETHLIALVYFLIALGLVLDGLLEAGVAP